MPRDAQETRDRLVRAAARLFAEHGIEAVSLRAINREAGQRNATALQYHFEGREGLLRAVLVRHGKGVEARRHALLDTIEAEARPADRRALAEALVLPCAELLADRDGGRDYLRVMAELVNRPEPVYVASTLADRRSSTNRWRRAVAPLLPPLAVDRLHRRFTAIRIMFVELARRAEGRPARDDRLFVSNLVDLVETVLATPPSAETAALLAERRPGGRAEAGRHGTRPAGGRGAAGSPDPIGQ